MWNIQVPFPIIPVDLADKDGKETGAHIIDVNGDGFADVVGNGVGVWLGNGLGGCNQDETDSWNTSLASAQVQFVEPRGDRRGADEGGRLIDVNSDGLPEGQANRGLPSEVKDLVEPGTYVSKLMQYDQYGNAVRLRNRNGYDTTFEYGEPTATFRTRAVDPEGRVVESGYHPGFGTLLWDKDARGNVTYKTYDPFGRLVKLILPGDEQSPFGTETYTYSPLGDAGA